MSRLSLEPLRRAVASVPREELALLGVVLFVALFVRLWGAFFGLPHVYHPDEGFEVYRALRLGMGGFDFERVPKGGYYFLLFAEYGFYLLGLMITGAVSSVGELAQRFVADPSAFWKIGRVTTALLGTATVFLVWWQGRRMGSSRGGLLGAFFLALSFRHVVDSHYITVDVPMALFAFWTIVMVVEDVAGRSRLKALPFALVSAFAVLNKLPAILVFIPYIVGAVLRGGWRGPRGLFTRATFGPALLSAAIYLVANPGFVLFFAATLGIAFGDGSGGGGDAAAGIDEYAGVEQRTNLWLFYARGLLQSQGPGLLALGLAGAVVGAWQRRRAVILHLSFLLPFFCLIAGASSAHLYYFRYIIPLLPGLCLLAGFALTELVRRVKLPWSVAVVTSAVLAAILVAEPGMSVLSWDRRQARTDTRTLAVDWVEHNLPHRTRILLAGFPEEDAQLLIPLQNTRKNVKEMVERLRLTDPGKAKFWELRLEALDPPLYDLVTVRHFEPWGTLDDYRAQGVEFAVLRAEEFIPGRRKVAKFDPRIVGSRYAFYEELIADDRVERVAEFRAAADGAPGYDLEIWSLGAEPKAPADGADDEDPDREPETALVSEEEEA